MKCWAVIQPPGEILQIARQHSGGAHLPPGTSGGETARGPRTFKVGACDASCVHTQHLQWSPTFGLCVTTSRG